MITRIDLFMPPRNQYGVLHHFTQKIYEALCRTGVSCRLLEAQYDNPQPFLDQIFADPPDCTLSFNGLLPDAHGRFFCDLIHTPHVACLVDAPNHFFSLVKSPLSIITCVDKSSCSFFQGLKGDHVLFMAHGVEKELDAGSHAERIYDVAMLSSCIDYEGTRNSWKNMFSPALCQVMYDAVERFFTDEKISYIDAFVASLSTYQGKQGVIDPNNIDFVQVFDELEDYIKGKERVELLRSITDARVDVFGFSGDGGSWEKYFRGKQPNIVIRDPVPYKQALEIMKQSKIVLNSNASSRNGAHERIFSAMMCGALPFTADNMYMHEHFKDGQDIAFYRYHEMDKVNEKINDYLAEEDKRQAVVARGRQVVLEEHTWDHRARELIRELEPILKSIKKTTIGRA